MNHNKLILGIIALLIVLATGCEDDFLDLDPKDSLTEAAFFKTPAHFEAAANQLYYGLIPFWNYDYYTDHGSDLSALPLETGRGTNLLVESDSYWTDGYKNLRDVNILLEKSTDYTGEAADIAQSVGTAYFFRAYQHFKLLERFGGVPLVTSVVDISTDVLYGPRNSRYEVVAQILSDLDAAIEHLPGEPSITAENKGKISSNAAQAFKARVLLYEASWEKYNGTSTDGDLTKVPADYPTINDMLSESAALSKAVIESGAYELWNYNNVLNDLSHYYLFNLEDGESNPAGLDKSSNKEYIIQLVFDYNLRRSGRNLSHTAAERRTPSRKFLDMFLCEDGLPVDKSAVFQGYNTVAAEFTNRDLRMNAYFNNIPEGSSPVLEGPSGGSSAGIGLKGRKFSSWNYGVYRAAEEESFNCPELRLAEVLLNYAEAVYELNGAITDEDLNLSINKLRARAGIAPLTNALVNNNGLNMLEEIRRERAIELYAENNRFFDLKRWGIAEAELGATVYGPIIEGTIYDGNDALYMPSQWISGTEAITVGDGTTKETLVIDPAVNRIFSKKNYLFPIPTTQIQLNPELVQNPGW